MKERGGPVTTNQGNSYSKIEQQKIKFFFTVDDKTIIFIALSSEDRPLKSNLHHSPS